MSVFKRKSKNGKETEEYHYSFMQKGKRYFGVCEGCTTKLAAVAYEKKIRDTSKSLSEQKSIGALVENFKRELTGGDVIRLKDAFELSLKKPRRRQASAELVKTKQAYWNDFLAFMEASYPEIENLDAVQTNHAEEYIQYLRTEGRFNKQISYSGPIITKKREYLHKSGLSAKTINTYHQTLAEVFTLLARDAGIINNPFTGIQKLTTEASTREAFSEEELRIIMEKADSFVKPLFTIAIATALREGDICTLKWSDIDFKDQVIRRTMNKTKHTVEIPIMQPLMEFFTGLHAKAMQQEAPSEFVLPEHAKMYQSNPSGVSYRVKQFLENTCGIETTKVRPGRSRAVSVKDLHSCRHTFCYFAGVYGIPLTVVQSIVGHMTPEMTAHYSAHASLQDKRNKMNQMPSFLFSSAEHSQEEPITVEVVADDKRSSLKQMIDLLDDAGVDYMLNALQEYKSKGHLLEEPSEGVSADEVSLAGTEDKRKCEQVSEKAGANRE